MGKAYRKGGGSAASVIPKTKIIDGKRWTLVGYSTNRKYADERKERWQRKGAYVRNVQLQGLYCTYARRTK